MANDLIKRTIITVIPATPGSAGHPGTPARPAYTYWVEGTCRSVYTPVVDYVCGSSTDSLEAGSAGASTCAHTIVGYTLETYCDPGYYVEVPATASQPPVAPTAPIPERVTYEFNPGWNNASGYTLGLVTVPGKFEFAVSAGAAGVICGLTPGSLNTGSGYFRIRYGFHLSGNRWQVFEAGVAKTDFATFTPSTARFAVEWDGRDIFYLVNDVVVYKSTVAFPGTAAAEPLVGVAALYFGGDSVLEAAFETAIFNGSAATSLRPLTGVTSETAQSYSFADLGILTGSAYQGVLSSAAGSLRPLKSYSSNNASYAFVDTLGVVDQ
jgi:hypothetical protein